MEDSMKLHLYDNTKVVVIDLGYKYTKVGLGGEHNPRFIIPTEVPTPVANQAKGVFDTSISSVLYDNLATFLHGIFFKRLIFNPKETKVIIVESLLCPTSLRRTIAKVLFKHLYVSAALFVPSHMVSLYTLAAPTALSVDLGYSESCAVPVFHGYPILNAYQVAPIGSRAIEAEIRVLLENHYAEHDPSRYPEVKNLSDKTIEEIKVLLCFVAPFNKASRIDKATSRPPDVTFPLAGAPPLKIPGIVREDACEVLFKPDIDGVCLPTLLLDAILKCPKDMRKALGESLLLFGGTSMLPGLRKRLSDELKDLLKTADYKDKLYIDHLKIYTPPCQANYTAWLGGSIIGATDTAVTRSMTRDEYNSENDVPDWANLKYNIKKEDTSRAVFSTRLL